MSEITFFVPGLPQPGGSKKAFVNPKTDQVVVVDDCKKNKPWRADVKAFAMLAHAGPPLSGPLALDVLFIMPRPKGHCGSGKNSSVIKASAPKFPEKKPDSTKLLRALEDALTGVLWIDDAQIVTQRVLKRFSVDGRIGAEVVVSRQG